MELYSHTAYELSELLTRRYSTSFSMSSRLFGTSIRPHIYAIYGLVRIADEIVDTYRGDDAKTQLDTLEHELHQAMTTNYSTNPIVHAFCQTAKRYAIGPSLTKPFFASMRTDLSKRQFSKKEYADYIYGSAEVIGLMCLEVFTDRQTTEVQRSGARALGAAYQKINFLRDIRTDTENLGRMYFPGIDSIEAFDDEAKNIIIADIENDLAKARPALNLLPPHARRAVNASYFYYTELLQKLRHASVAELTQQRIRVSDSKKVLLLVKAWLGATA